MPQCLCAFSPSHPDHPANACIPQTVKERLAHEFELIRDLDYPAYFLTVDDIVGFARSRGILCQGRGAAANSAVCYCLGITAVDPARIDLLVERFISRERDEPPDIDIDFEHERREEVIQYLYQKYGRDRAALTAEVISYRRRSAVREVGKALGLSLDCVDRLAKSGDWWENDVITESRLRELGFDPGDATLRQTIALAGELIGFPRHLSQHVGGFVISKGPLCEIVPIENAAMPERTIIEWDKDDIDAMGMLKVDVLGLGMLTAIRKGIDLVNAWMERGEGKALRHKGTEALRGEEGKALRHKGTEALRGGEGKALRHKGTEALRGGEGKALRHKGTEALREMGGKALRHKGTEALREEGEQLLPSGGGISTSAPAPLSALVPQCLSAFPLQFHTIPPEDSRVYEMLCRADSIGVFQVESRAQMTMLPRLRPRCYYDLVIEVAIVRPGPIQGDMVHPYLRRRNSTEKIEYPSAAVKRVLERTLGVPLFQEQAMSLVMVAAGFTAGEADQLRRAMAAWKRKGNIIEKFSAKILSGMTANGYTPAYAQRVVQQIKGFADYGFPESHAASFALLVYVSAWLKCHHPAAFAAALINSQPMGFYQPAQIVRDARDHGVEVLAVDVNFSGWDCSLARGNDEIRMTNDESNSNDGMTNDRNGNADHEGMKGRRSTKGRHCLRGVALIEKTGIGHGWTRMNTDGVGGCVSNLENDDTCLGDINGGDGGLNHEDTKTRRTAKDCFEIDPCSSVFIRGQFQLSLPANAPLSWATPPHPFVSSCLRGSIRFDHSSFAPSDLTRHSSFEFRHSRPALRLGMRLVSGLREAEARKIAETVAREGRFDSIVSLWRKSGVRADAFRKLAAADAFLSMGLDRQAALWQVMQLRDDKLPLLELLEEDAGGGEQGEGISGGDSGEEAASSSLLPPVPMRARVVYDYAATGLSLKAHPVSFARAGLARAGVTPAGDMADEKKCPHGRRVSVAGLVLVRQRPGTASGIVFMTLEDETGIANLVVRPKVYEAYRAALRHSVGIVAHGKVERQGQVVHVLIHGAESLSGRLAEVESGSRDFH